MSSENSIDTGPITMRLRTLSLDQNLHVLLVDDDELERAFLCDRLEGRGFQVSQASNGQEALELLERELVPVLVVDWRMPVMDGIEFTEQLRARGITDPYVIMLTSRDGEVDIERGYLAGVDDYLTKKVHETQLLARVHTAFNTFELRRELRQLRAELEQLKGAPR